MSNKIKLTVIEIEILALFIDGLNYSEVQKELNSKYNTDEYSGRKLEYRLRDIKKKMGVRSLFSLGYTYADLRCDQILEQATKVYEVELSEETKTAYLRGLKEIGDDDKKLHFFRGALVGSTITALISLVILLWLYFQL